MAYRIVASPVRSPRPEEIIIGIPHHRGRAPSCRLVTPGRTRTALRRATYVLYGRLFAMTAMPTRATPAPTAITAGARRSPPCGEAMAPSVQSTVIMGSTTTRLSRPLSNSPSRFVHRQTLRSTDTHPSSRLRLSRTALGLTARLRTPVGSAGRRQHPWRRPECPPQTTASEAGRAAPPVLRESAGRAHSGATPDTMMASRGAA